jgi:hypothetical protein
MMMMMMMMIMMMMMMMMMKYKINQTLINKPTSHPAALRDGELRGDLILGVAP